MKYRESWETWVTSSRCGCPPFTNGPLLKILLRIMFNSFCSLDRICLIGWWSFDRSTLFPNILKDSSWIIHSIDVKTQKCFVWKSSSSFEQLSPPLDKNIRKTNTWGMSSSEGSDSRSEGHNLKFREPGDTPTSISSDSENCLNTYSVPHLDIAWRIISPLSEHACSQTPASPNSPRMSTAFFSLGLSPITSREVESLWLTKRIGRPQKAFLRKHVYRQTICKSFPTQRLRC